MQTRRAALLSVAALVAMAAGACQTESDESPEDHGSCYVLIECADQLGSGTRQAIQKQFGPVGSCWGAGVEYWPRCRDACAAALDTLNHASSGATCGTCTRSSDCAAFGSLAYCLEGRCAGGDVPDVGHADGAGDDGDGDLPSTCGWYKDPDLPGYYCGGKGVDPSGIFPYACPPGLVEGAVCGQVTGQGCCDANGDSWYCGEDWDGQFLVREDC